MSITHPARPWNPPCFIPREECLVSWQAWLQLLVSQGSFPGCWSRQLRLRSENLHMSILLLTLKGPSCFLLCCQLSPWGVRMHGGLGCSSRTARPLLWRRQSCVSTPWLLLTHKAGYGYNRADIQSSQWEFKSQLKKWRIRYLVTCQWT